jgi:SEC-C motif-containing protein
MRSRYTAFTKRDEKYLSDTWHSSTRPAYLDLNDKAPIKWLSLTVVNANGGGEDDAEGTVEFVALFKVNGKAERLHELSRFRKEDGRWYYVDGEMREVAKKTRR